MKVQEIRAAFLDFFNRKGHKIIKSSSLIPQGDPSLLFTNAGMNQFKNVFLGLDKTNYKRAASVQKCMRVSGKHNDFEEVGRSSKHHTFFEMLGNFSFGDYFKKKCIEYSWELILDVYKINSKKLYITVYKEDDEAFDIWNKDIGIKEDRIFRLGKEENYWSMGNTGPCGPCSEIHYELDTEYEKGDPKKLIERGSDRFIELWNLVFMQFNRDEKGKLHSLPAPSVDTGMGLERMVTVLQKKKSNYDTELFMPIINAVCDLSDYEYPSLTENDIQIRIISDHLRAISFLIGDGIMPANEGRGYVLRRLIRRAFRAGNRLGLNKPFLFKLTGCVIDVMKDSYPEMISSASYISTVCQAEEKRFYSTLSAGLKTLQLYISEAKKGKEKIISGERLFKLYDTHGFPIELSKELAEEEKLSIDESGFHNEMEKQRTRARQAWKGDAKRNGIETYKKVKDINTQFLGYKTNIVIDAEVQALMKNGTKVESLKKGDKGEIFLNETPFYAEAGGQVGDKGILKNTHFSALVEKVFSPISDVISHKIKVVSGDIRVGGSVEAAIDKDRRRCLSKNHSATHLLHSSLRQILGDHVKQAGSLVSPFRLRFDFTHFDSITTQEIKAIESLVNEKIQENIPITTRIASYEQAIKEGAVAIFKEKYKEKVRIVTVRDFSKELCGGSHVENTGNIGLFKIISEGSVAAGIRRIEALTGLKAVEYVQRNEDLLLEIQQCLGSSRDEILSQLDKLKIGIKNKEKENKTLRHKITRKNMQKKGEETRKIKNISVFAKIVEGLNSSELREMADEFKQKIKSGIVILGTTSENKASLVVVVSKDLLSKIKADEIIRRLAPFIGGGGGGRPDFAQAGGSQIEGLSKSLKKSYSIIEEMLD